MKRILITGKNSYVGNNLADWLGQYPGKYKIEKISVRDKRWIEIDFSIYDAIVHVAGIVHKRETLKNKNSYYDINRDLSLQIAKKAKDENVPQFIFLSTMSVYGLEEGTINDNTIPLPITHYGKSKLQAEEKILELGTDSFKISIIRPPMIYGPNCPGNYQRLRRLTLYTPVFPNVYNQRSMIYIDNLSEFIRVIIKDTKEGIFFPQNKEYVSTTQMVKYISKYNNKRMLFLKQFNWIISIMNFRPFKKLFGQLIYETSIINVMDNFIELEESIKETEKEKL